jgi:hypothetical protein
LEEVEMKSRLAHAFTEGFKGSFRLAYALVAAIPKTIVAFAQENHADRRPPADNARVTGAHVENNARSASEDTGR